MQCRDSLGMSTKNPRLSKGSTRKFRTRRSQSSFSSVSDVFTDNESNKGQADLSVSRMKLARRASISIKGEASRPERRAVRWWTPLTKGNERSFDLTLSQTRTSNGRKSRGQRRPRKSPRPGLRRKCCKGGCPNKRLRVISGEKNLHTRQVHTHLWPSRATTR